MAQMNRNVNLEEIDAAHVGRRRKASQIADDAAAQGDNRVRTGQIEFG